MAERAAVTEGEAQARVAVLRNRASTRNRSGAPVAVPEGARLHETEDLAALDAALREIRAAGAELLIIDGGDGTVREVVSRLPGLWPDGDLPRLAILAHGNTNLIARKVGAATGARGLAAILAGHRDGRLDEALQPLLKIDRGAGGTPILGFIAGWGAYETGTRIAIEELGSRGGRQVAQAVIAVLRRALWGAEAQAIRTGIEARVEADGVPLGAEGSARLVGLVTTMPGRLVLGLKPFWGKGPGAIRWLDVDAPGRWLGLAAPFALFGRPMGWMRRGGYRSGRAERIAVHLPPGTGFVVDGERFETGPRGRLTIAVGPSIRFVSPGG